MSNKDFHNKEFDSATLKKLDIYREYFNESFPVFLYGNWKNVVIYDFFAGEGTDRDGTYGSPLIAYESVSSFCKIIKEKKTNVVLRFNEKNPKKFGKLNENINNYIDECKGSENCPNPDTGCIIKKGITKNDFTELFNEIYPAMQKDKNPRIIFLDQFGFKHITKEVFLKFVELPRTDFIFFVASSYLNRFKKIEFFNKYLEVEKINFDTSIPAHCHRHIANYYESLISGDKEYYTAHFSIKKGRNYYGLIFGSNHLLGIEKFLKICWKHDPVTGEANYNIDREMSYYQKTLFEEMNVATKIKTFQESLRDKILNKEIVILSEIYKEAFKNKCLPEHANEVLSELIDKGILGKLKLQKSSFHKMEDVPLTIKR